MKRFLVVLAVVFAACTSNTNTSETSSLSSVDSNAANNTPLVSTDNIVIQTFTQLPYVSNCSALFVSDTSNQQNQYVFVTDLKGTAFIKLNNRLMELKLVKQTNFDKYTVNELYINDEIEVELKIKQLKETDDAGWNYQGVLVVRRAGKSDAINISGKVGC